MLRALTLLLPCCLMACGNFVDGFYAPDPGSNQPGGGGDVGNANTNSDTNPNTLIVGSYDGSNVASDNLGGDIACDHCTVSDANGQLQFVYDGSGSYFGLSNAFRSDWCEYSLAQYGTLQFQLSTSAGSKVVQVILHIGDGTCPQDPAKTITWNVTATPALQTFSLPLSNADRQYAISIEMDPQSVDQTKYYLDNLVLIR